MPEDKADDTSTDENKKTEDKDEAGSPKADGQASGESDASSKDKSQDKKPSDKDQEAPDQKEKTRLPWWPFVVVGLIVIVFVAVVLWLIFRPKPDVWTDDAYVRVHYATIAPRVSGQVTAVPVDDNQIIKVGDLLAQLDPRDFETAIASAQAQVERQQAQIGDVGATVDKQPAVIEETAADVDAAQARLAFAEADAHRYDNLAATGAGTAQQRQQANTRLKENQAALRSAQAQLNANRIQLDVLKKQKSAAEATLKADLASLEQARLNLSYTRILAPVDGMVGERSVQVGDVLAPGQTLMTVVPLQEVYVNANYREVDLIHMRAGQPVTIHVDAYNIDLNGHVNAIPAASGASFAPIAPSNATGNFTKIVQRLPVRIDVDPGQPLANLLRVGFSVETTVHTDLEDVVREQAHDRRAVTGR